MKETIEFVLLVSVYVFGVSLAFIGFGVIAYFIADTINKIRNK